ncbi:hypothetical protein GN316_15760 [Xylophilus sp. Kf1]|nr:hypothetical protein [Xylophilus sp. Kf1]
MARLLDAAAGGPACGPAAAPGDRHDRRRPGPGGDRGRTAGQCPHRLDRQPGQCRTTVALRQAGPPLQHHLRHAVGPPGRRRTYPLLGCRPVIFVTVGTQLPFDRLIHAVDGWSTTHATEVFAQIADSEKPPRHIAWSRFLSPQDTRRHMEDADIIVAHAGMGSILTALSMGKRIIVMPRQAALHEHRNDHQMASAHKLQTTSGLTVAADDQALFHALDTHVSGMPLAPIRHCASHQLLANLKHWIDG